MLRINSANAKAQWLKREGPKKTMWPKPFYVQLGALKGLGSAQLEAD
jgi:hypothetical protein